MSPVTWDAAELAQRVREERERLAKFRGVAARYTAEAWWLRRLVVTTVSHPGSMQHALAAGVVAGLPRERVEAHLRTSAPRRDDAA